MDNKKPITIDDLAVMVQKGFDNVDSQFTQVRGEFSEQFTQVHQELRSIRKELEGMVYRPEFEALQDKVRDMDRVLNMLKKKAA